MSSCEVSVRTIIVKFELDFNFLCIFSKNTHTKFHENPLGGSRVLSFGRTVGRTDRQTDRRADGRTDRQADRQTERHEEANRRFSQFCIRA
jgi:hypothetical protein